MAYGITRVHGGVAAGTFHGGYQLRWFSIAGTGFDSATLTDSYANNFEVAVRAIGNVASVVVLGGVGAAGFVVGLDAATFVGRGDSTGYAADTAAADLDVAITNALKNINGNGGGGISTTVTEKVITGVAFANA